MDVRGPDGKVTRFPDGTPDDTVHAVMTHIYTPHLSGLAAAGMGAEKAAGALAQLAVDHVPGMAAVDRFGQKLGLPSTAQSNANSDAIRANSNHGATMAGEIAGTMAIPEAKGLKYGGAIANGIGGALLSDKKDLGGKLTDGAIAAVGGEAVKGAFKVAGKIVAPKFSAAVEELRKHGILVTPGQALGGAAKALEDKLTSVPIVGDMINSARNRGLLSFNTAVLNRALAPIGEALPKGVQAGREAIAHVGDKLSEAYDKIVPGMAASVDREVVDGLNGIARNAKTLPADMQHQFSSILGNIFQNRVVNGRIQGDAIKEAQASLQAEARAYSRSGDPDKMRLGHMFNEASTEFNDWLARHNPAAAGALKKVNEGWAQLVRIERAGGAAGSEAGVFTPKAYSAAVKAADSSARKRAVARGEALGQDLSDKATSLLPSKIADSGTAARTMTGHIVAGVAGGAAAHFVTPGAAALAAPALLYTGAGQKAVNALVDRGLAAGPKAKAVAKGLNALAPYASRATPALLSGPDR